MESVLASSDSWLGLTAAVAMLAVGYLARKYLIPFLAVGHRQQYARFIAAIADEVTDELRAKYPDREWLRHLDEAVDQLIAICGVGEEVAGRAVRAASARK
jgi:hypothetical protein